jgi:hypothetical protein
LEGPFGGLSFYQERRKKMAKKDAEKRYDKEISLESDPNVVHIRIPSGFYTLCLPVEDGWMVFGSAGACQYITDPHHQLFRKYFNDKD